MMKSLLALIAGTLCWPALAADYLREQEIAEQLSQHVEMGEAVELNADNRTFLALYMQTTELNNLGSVILLHDQGGSPDQRPIPGRLRLTIAAHQWATLAIQLPILDLDANADDYYAVFPEAKLRIKAAMAYLTQGQVQNIVLVGYGLGALMGLYAIKDDPAAVKAMVLINLKTPSAPAALATIDPLAVIESLKVPVLDIYAGNDATVVPNSLYQRKLAGRANEDYRQDKIPNADYRFLHHYDLLSKRIYSWLTEIITRQNNRP